MDDLTPDADLHYHLFKPNSRGSRSINAAAYIVEPLGAPRSPEPVLPPAVLAVMPCGAEAPASARAVRRMGLVAGRVALL